MNGTVSVHLSVCPSVRLLQVCCWWPSAQEISIDLIAARRAAAAASTRECGQCHVVSVRKNLNTDLLLVVLPTTLVDQVEQSVACVFAQSAA